MNKLFFFCLLAIANLLTTSLTAQDCDPKVSVRCALIEVRPNATGFKLLTGTGSTNGTWQATDAGKTITGTFFKSGGRFQVTINSTAPPATTVTNWTADKIRAYLIEHHLDTINNGKQLLYLPSSTPVGVWTVAGGFRVTYLIAGGGGKTFDGAIESGEPKLDLQGCQAGPVRAIQKTTTIIDTSGTAALRATVARLEHENRQLRQQQNQTGTPCMDSTYLAELRIARGQRDRLQEQNTRVSLALAAMQRVRTQDSIALTRLRADTARMGLRLRVQQKGVSPVPASYSTLPGANDTAAMIKVLSVQGATVQLFVPNGADMTTIIQKLNAIKYNVTTGTPSSGEFVANRTTMAKADYFTCMVSSVAEGSGKRVTLMFTKSGTPMGKPRDHADKFAKSLGETSGVRQAATPTAANQNRIKVLSQDGGTLEVLFPSDMTDFGTRTMQALSKQRYNLTNGSASSGEFTCTRTTMSRADYFTCTVSTSYTPEGTKVSLLFTKSGSPMGKPGDHAAKFAAKITTM